MTTSDQKPADDRLLRDLRAYARKLPRSRKHWDTMTPKERAVFLEREDVREGIRRLRARA